MLYFQICQIVGDTLPGEDEVFGKKSVALDCVDATWGRWDEQLLSVYIGDWKTEIY